MALTDAHGIRGAAKVVTLEYGSFESEYPTHEFIRPNEFRERYLAGTLDEFDAIFTYSSVEHSGLGMSLYDSYIFLNIHISYLCCQAQPSPAST